MVDARKHAIDLFVDKQNQQWVARDGDGNYWVLPLTTNPWDDRKPFHPAEETALEFIPGHYKHLLGVPY